MPKAASADFGMLSSSVDAAVALMPQSPVRSEMKVHANAEDVRGQAVVEAGQQEGLA